MRQVPAQLGVGGGAGERTGERKEPAAVDDASVEVGKRPAWIRHLSPSEWVSHCPACVVYHRCVGVRSWRERDGRRSLDYPGP